MKTKFTNKSFLVLALAFFISFSIFGSNSSERKLGVGLSIGHELSRYNSYNEHLVLTMIDKNLKFELQTMLFNDSDSSNGISDSPHSLFLGDISFGLYSVDSLRNDFNIYYGAKLGVIFSMESSSSRDDNDIRLIYISPVLGGEYFFIPNFSISVEAALKLMIEDNEEGSNKHYFNTLTSLLLKFYF